MKTVNINKKPVDNQTVETLEELLKEAKNGNLHSIIYVDSYNDGRVGSGWTLPPNVKMLGELELLKINLSMAMLEEVSYE